MAHKTAETRRDGALAARRFQVQHPLTPKLMFLTFQAYLPKHGPHSYIAGADAERLCGPGIALDICVQGGRWPDWMWPQTARGVQSPPLLKGVGTLRWRRVSVQSSGKKKKYRPSSHFYTQLSISFPSASMNNPHFTEAGQSQLRLLMVIPKASNGRSSSSSGGQLWSSRSGTGPDPWWGACIPLPGGGIPLQDCVSYIFRLRFRPFRVCYKYTPHLALGRIWRLHLGR